MTRTFPVRGSSATTAPHLAPELLERDLLRVEVEVDDDVVALDRLAAELVDCLVDAVERLAFEEVR